MPGTAAHLTIIEQQTVRAAADPAKFGIVADVLQSHPKAAALGAIGPDMMFWADWGQYTGIVNAIFDVYKTLDEIYDTLMALWGPVQDAIDKEMDTLTGGLTTEISETVDLVEGIIQTAALNFLTDSWNYYSILRPKFQVPLQNDADPGNPGYQPIPVTQWNWLDYLHHRGTGRFARALIARAKQSGDPEQMAYAAGWLSHVTADVVGHAYVNQAVGGPWRTHYQRHHIQENFMDVWTYGFYNGGVSMPASAPPPGVLPFDYAAFPNLNTANLHQKIGFGDDLPAGVLKLIADTLAAVYGPVDHPVIQPIGGSPINMLGTEEINRAYQQLSFALELMTGKDRHIPMPQPPSVFGDNTGPSFPNPFGGSGGAGNDNGSFSLWDLLLAILNFIKELFEFVHDLVSWLVSMVTHALTYPVRYGLYLLQLSLYEIYRQFRWALVVAGYVYPEPDELAQSYAQQFINPAGTIANVPHLEWMPFADSKGESQNCTVYPSNGTELPAASPGPYTRFPLNYPFWFIQGEPTDPAVETALTNASSPSQTMSITQNLFFPSAVLAAPRYRGSLGSAFDFYLRRAAEVAAAGGDSTKLVLPNWNLDADRGYGFKCWRETSPLAPPPPPSGPNNPATWTVSVPSYLPTSA